MGLFDNQKALDRLEDRLRHLEVKCEDLERGRKSLDMEFNELYDKVSHQMSRMSKRYAAKQKENGPDPEILTEELPFPDKDPISRSILLRRGGVRSSE